MSSLLHFMTHADGLATLLTLIVLEIVLGIDNLVFIAILVNRVEAEKQSMTRRLGLGLVPDTAHLWWEPDRFSQFPASTSR